MALRNGTMGWSLAGLMPDSGKTKRFTEPSTDGLARAKAAAERVAKRFGVMRIDLKALESFRADLTRTLYVFDVRDPTDYAAGHFPGAINAPEICAVDAQPPSPPARITTTARPMIRCSLIDRLAPCCSPAKLIMIW